ncbi:ATP-binding protein [Muricoccus radiodurans]|uniref:ATP-binding protein n=1 Tax=Muricoccus radiodurans TaxID=2231721 RepID=UPI003CEB6CDA
MAADAPPGQEGAVAAGEVLVLAPMGRNAESAGMVLTRHGIRVRIVQDVRALAAAIGDDTGAALVTEEALEREGIAPLRAALQAQPPWSSLPFVILARARTGPLPRGGPRVLPQDLTNAMTLERPLSAGSLVSAVDWALAARRRQVQIRDHLAELEHRTQRLRESEAALMDLTVSLEERVAAEVAERRQAEDLLRQAQKMEAVGQLTGGIAHDFNNLLTGIIGALDLLKRRMREGRTDGLDRYMDAASTSATRAAALTHRLLAFSRRQSLDARPVDVNRLVRSMEDLLHRTLGERVTLETALDPGAPHALVDENQLESALLNLAINARDAMPDGGRLVIETGRDVLDEAAAAAQEGLRPGAYVRLTVRDTGIGMPPDMLEKVFEPFFTTKPIGQGTGLGLSMIYGFARQSGGHAWIDSVPGEGTAVSLTLPEVAAPSHAAPEVTTDEAPRAAEGETVLVVEDDPAVRLLAMEVLRELGYAAREAGSAEEALPILRGNGRLDLLVSDVGLPGTNGRQLAEMARSIRPGLRVLLMTGYAEAAATRGRFLEPGMEMVTKPFALDDLARTIRRIIEGRPRD